MTEQEAKININGTDYVVSDLSNETRQMLDLYQDLQRKLVAANREAATYDLAMRQLGGLIDESLTTKSSAPEGASE